MSMTTNPVDKAQTNGACECQCAPSDATQTAPQGRLVGFSGSLFALFGGVIVAIVVLAVLGEVFGWLDKLNARVPWPFWLAAVLLGGYRIFRNVLRATWRRKITSHTLMTMGLVAAAAVGQWSAALLIVFFMRLAEYVENFTSARARHAVRELISFAPQMARVVRKGQELEVPAKEVAVGEIVVVRPGEKIPVDGEVIAGQATLNQAAISGESMPVEAGPGARVYAATLAQLGALRIRATSVGQDTTFGHIIRLVEEAEGHRAEVQRLADRFSAWYLPIVAGIAAITFLLSRNVLATAAVLMVACSCSFAMATPVAMIASIGAAARRGLLIKGSRYLEALARVDVILLDKTGTLTLGRPEITDVVTLDGLGEHEVLALAATAERYSEHPLAEAVRHAASVRGVPVAEPKDFEAVPGVGVRAHVNGSAVAVGGRRLFPEHFAAPPISGLEDAGKTLLFITRDQQPVGVLAAADTLRHDVPAALTGLRSLGISRIELLTGDNDRVASALAARLGIEYRANLLPEDKIEAVKRYQAQGLVVAMIGDGVNDAPALAQADIGIAMGVIGSDVAIEAADIALMREDWSLIPHLVRIARRTMRVVRLNLIFTGVYNLVGLGAASFGLLPPVFAAAAQSLPDFGIIANSARLLRSAGTSEANQRSRSRKFVG